MKRITLWLAVAALGLGTFAACTQKDAGTYTIGVVMPLTGGIATFGTECWQGIQLAVEKINKDGGINGKTLVMNIQDNRGEPQDTMVSVKKLITVDNVLGIIGAVASSNTAAATGTAQNLKCPMLTPASTNVDITKVGDYISRICYIDSFQGSVLARFALENMKKKTAVIVSDASSDYSIGLAQVFEATFIQGGGTVAGTVSYAAGDKDFASQVTRVKEMNPDVVFIPGYYTEVALIVRQARQQGLHTPMLGGDGWSSPKLAELAGDAIAGNFFSDHFAADDTDPKVQEFVKSYEERYKVKPGAMAALGWDAALVMADALKRMKTVDATVEGTRAALKDAINTTKDFNGVTGSITIDANRNAVKDAVILETTPQGFKFAAKIKPA